MAVLNLSNPIFHMDDPATGGPLVGGLVYTYVAGTSTELTTYTDSSLGTSNTNPVVLNAYGDAPIWFDQSMKIVVRSADTLTTYYTFDNISPVGGTTTVAGNYNLVLNGSFESGTASDVSNWTLTPYSGATIAVDTTNVTHGLQSLKFDGLTGVGGGSADSGYFNVRAGSNLAVSLTTMASNATTTNDATIYWFQSDGTTPSATVSTVLGLPASGSYPTSMTAYTFIVNVPSDATRAYIKLVGIDSGGSNLDADCWFEDVTITENPLIPSTLGTVQASKTVTADANGNITFNAASTNHYLNFTTGSTNTGLYASTGGVFGFYDFTNVHFAQYYTPSTNETVFPGSIAVSGGVTGNLTGNVTGDVTATTITKSSIPVYGLVVLDTPIQLLSSSTTGSWTQHDMSAGAGSAAATAGATKAILRVTSTTNDNSSTGIYTKSYIRKTGSGLAANNLTKVTDGYEYASSATIMTALAENEIIVNLDSNSDFDWYHAATGTAGSDVTIVLVGYYV